MPKLISQNQSIILDASKILVNIKILFSLSIFAVNYQQTQNATYCLFII